MCQTGLAPRIRFSDGQSAPIAAHFGNSL